MSSDKKEYLEYTKAQLKEIPNLTPRRKIYLTTGDFTWFHEYRDNTLRQFSNESLETMIAYFFNMIEKGATPFNDNWANNKPAAPLTENSVEIIKEHIATLKRYIRE